MEINRGIYLQRLINRMHNGMVKVVTGPRRCGKTYLLFELFANWLRENGIAEEHIVEVSLDTEEDARLRDPAALSAYLREHTAEKATQYYVLLDEVQYAISAQEMRGQETPRIYGVLNGLLRKRNIDVYVTGSNSRMLSTDVLTEFRGRGDEVRVHPLSFAEFMQGFEGDAYRGWAEYIVFGGMPLTLSMKTDEQKARYLERLFAETYLKDIVARNGVAKTHELEELTDVLASSIGCLISPPKLEATFKSSSRSSISANTISAYIGYLEDAFVLERASRYDVKGRRHIGSPQKAYFEDMGLRNARLGFRQVEETHIMENIVYNELRLRGYAVDVGIVEKRRSGAGTGQRAQLEVDFVATLGARRCYIQSALHMPDERKAGQEKAPLREIGDSFKKIVLVQDIVKPTWDEDGILTMNVHDFLLDSASLET